jgi:high-affinity iron transporter
VKLNLATFFRWTGAALVVVAAGVLAYGFHDLQESGLFTFGGLDRVLVDATGVLPPSSWWGSLFKGLFSISAAPTRLELGAWLLYLIPTMTLFLRRSPSSSSSTAGPAGPAATSSQPAARSSNPQTTEVVTP